VVWLGSADIRPCCTLERHHPNGGVARTVAELLTLAMVESDNTAADALLKLVGGVEVVQRRSAIDGLRGDQRRPDRRASSCSTWPA
jgi:beta-lactamase class A